MNDSKFSRQDLKRQEKMSNARRNVLAFVVSLLFLAVLMFFASVLDVWGEEDERTACDDAFAAFHAAHQPWWGGDCANEDCTEFKDWPTTGWTVVGSKCDGGRVHLKCINWNESPPKFFQYVTGDICPKGAPSSTSTPTATRGKGGPSNPGQPPSLSTPTPTATLLIIYPEGSDGSASKMTPTSTTSPGALPPSMTEPKETQPTPTPRPFVSPCLVQHAGSPLNLCDSGDGWRMYFFGHDGAIRTGPYVPRWGGGRDGLFVATVNPLTGKPVLVQWVAEYRAVRVITYYDHHPYAAHKPYIFDIMPDNMVIHRVW